MEVYGIDDPALLGKLGGDNDNTRYILKYCKNRKVDAKFAVIEENYVDRDFCVDYSKYYSSSHGRRVRRVCRRVHFFGVATGDELRDLFKSSKNTNELQDRYCGFTVVNGITGYNTNEERGHIGRTVLRTYCGAENTCDKETDRKSVFHTIPQKVSLFGHDLIINALPFTSKDENVGMCATAALWVTQFPLIERYGGQRASLYEITDIAIKDASNRRFSANRGLTDDQMMRYLSR